MKKNNIILSAVFALALSQGLAARAEEQLKLSVANSVRQGIIEKIAAPFEKETGIKLVLSKFEKQVSSSQYFKDLIDGKVVAAIGSLSYADWLGLMKKDKIEVLRPQELTQRVIGHDLMGVFASPKAGVMRLTLEQVSDVFTGNVKNWKEVGGADLPVTILIIKPRASNNTNFQKIVMGGKPFADRKELESIPEMYKLLVELPGAVGFDSKSSKPQGSVLVETPLIGRPTTLLTYGRPSPSLQKLIDFIRTEGKKYGVGQ